MPARKSRRRSSRPSQPARSARPLPTHDAAGVDLTLIRWMLSLTPRERLEANRRAVRAILRLRHARVRA